MSPAVSKHMIVLDRGTNVEREAIHAAVKVHANGWWHQLADTWIVGGGTAFDWTEKLKGTVPPFGPSTVVVVAIGDGWGFYGPNAAKRAEWLHEHL